jgi:hypothetical protein
MKVSLMPVPYVLFPSCSQLVEKMIHVMVIKCVDMDVSPKLAIAIIISISFNL